VAELIGQVSRESVALAVFPECSLSGYHLARDAAEVAAVEIPGPETRRLSDLADRFRMTLVVGLLERTSTGLYNAAVVFRPGQAIVSYRKTHLPQMGVDRFCQRGRDAYRPIDTPIGAIGVLICYDLRFPEPARLLALSGATLLAVPTNWPTTASDYPDFLLRARASENRLPIVAADRCGTDVEVAFLGRSQIVGYDGAVIAEAGSQDETLVASLELGTAPGTRRIAGRPDGPGGLLTDRRSDLYELSVQELHKRSTVR
jgi:predicted amidohydrolase